MRESVPRTGRKPAGELPLQRRTVPAPSVQRSSRPGACACGGGCPRCAGPVLQRSPEDEALPAGGSDATGAEPLDGGAAKGDWTPPPATTFPDVSEDPRVVKKRPASFPGNPPPPVGWKYWPVSKKVTPAAKKLADIGKAPETVPGTFVRDMVGGELIAVRSEWHSFTVLGDEKKPGLYKGGSLMVPVDAPKTQSAEPEGSIALQRAPAVSQPGDRFEREADAVADRVMRSGPAPSPQPVSHGVPPSGKSDAEAGPDAHTAARVAGQGGEPLPAPVRDFFEPRFGHDLSGVRVHTGSAAEQGARAVQARAYTLGADIVFGAGEFAPHSDSGRHLLAHELTHVLQQQGAPMQPQAQPLRRQPAPATATTTAAATAAAAPPDPLAAALTDSEWRQVDLWMSRGVIGIDKLGANATENANLIAANLFCERALYAPEFREGDLPPVCLFPRLATDNPRVMALSKEVARFGPLVHWPAVPLDNRLVRAMDRLVDVHAFPVNAAAGIVGNLFVESAVLPSRIEGSDESTPMRSPRITGKPGVTGRATDFSPPEVKGRDERKQVGPQPPGIGLGQWTTPARRDALFARQGKGASILFDMDAQVDFLVAEVRAVRGLDAALMRAGISADAASDEFLYQFEIPKSITDGNGGKRPRSDPAVQTEFGTRRRHSQSALRAYRKAHP